MRVSLYNYVFVFLYFCIECIHEPAEYSLMPNIEVGCSNTRGAPNLKSTLELTHSSTNIAILRCHELNKTWGAYVIHTGLAWWFMYTSLFPHASSTCSIVSKQM